MLVSVLIGMLILQPVYGELCHAVNLNKEGFCVLISDTTTYDLCVYNDFAIDVGDVCEIGV